MTNIFVSSGIIAIIYLILGILRQKYILKENKPLKTLVTDSVVVLLSSAIGLFAVENLDKGVLSKSSPTAFVGSPDF